MVRPGPDFRFHAELLELRSGVLDALAQRGFAWLTDFGSVDVDHEQYGIEVTAIRERCAAVHIQRILREVLPSWKHSSSWYEDQNGGELGWKVIVCRDPDGWQGWWFDDACLEAPAEGYDEMAVFGERGPAPPPPSPDQPSRVPTMLLTVPSLQDESLALEARRWPAPAPEAEPTAPLDNLELLVGLLESASRNRRDQGLAAPPAGSARRARRFFAARAAHGTILLLRRGSVAVGGCVLSHTAPSRWPRSTGVRPAAYLSGLVVDPALQGLGLGMRILGFADRVAGDWQLERLRTECPPNAPPLLRFLRAAGFADVGAARTGWQLVEKRVECGRPG